MGPVIDIKTREHHGWQGIVTMRHRIHLPDCGEVREHGHRCTCQPREFTRTKRNLITAAGQNLLAQVLANQAASAAIFYVGMGDSGGILLQTALTSGNAYTSLALQAALPFALSDEQSLTLVSGAHSQVVDINGAVAAGVTSLTVDSFTANFSYPMGTFIVLSPASTDVALAGELFRKAITTYGVTGAQANATTYIAPQEANTFTTQELGWFASPTAQAGAGTGVLLARTLYSHAKSNLESIQSSRADVFN